MVKEDQEVELVESIRLEIRLISEYNSHDLLIFGKNITSNSKAVAKTQGYGDWTNWNGPLSAPYWIIKLDSNYEWVIIGQPSRKGFWIMSRKPTMEKPLLD